jgi:hypothetical protein
MDTQTYVGNALIDKIVMMEYMETIREPMPIKETRNGYDLRVFQFCFLKTLEKTSALNAEPNTLNN